MGERGHQRQLVTIGCFRWELSLTVPSYFLNYTDYEPKLIHKGYQRINSYRLMFGRVVVRSTIEHWLSTATIQGAVGEVVDSLAVQRRNARKGYHCGTVNKEVISERVVSGYLSWIYR